MTCRKMKKIRIILLYFTVFVSILVISASLLSLFHNLTYWYSKILDFPRLQYLIISLVCFIAFILLNRKWNFSRFLLVIALLVTAYIQLDRILPYWIGEKTVPDAMSNSNSTNKAEILIANVLISNKESQKFLQVVEESAPDILLVMEVNQWWIDQLQSLKQEYPYSIEYPLDNAYGMALYSKLPLEEKEIKFYQHKDVPSFHAKVTLPSNKQFYFHGVHPVAPFPSGKYPDNVGKKEVALLKTADLVAEQQLPAIVAGDLNDVSWSNTSRLFKDTGNLSNVRIGRGLFNSFDANSKLMRWPLDHYFVTTKVSLLNLEKLSSFGSDHFPMLAEFVFTSNPN